MGNKSSKSKYKQQLASGQHLQVLYQQDYIQRTRLGVAIEAIANYFLHNFKGDDGFALATFSTYYKSAESRDAVGNGVIEAEQPLWDLAEITPVGATRLYSSIKDAVDEFEKVSASVAPAIRSYIPDIQAVWHTLHYLGLCILSAHAILLKGGTFETCLPMCREQKSLS